MDEAPKSYRERQKEARAAASAIRKAAEERRREAMMQYAKAKYDARKAIREAIRGCGKKPMDFSVREINEWAEAIAQY